MHTGHTNEVGNMLNTDKNLSDLRHTTLCSNLTDNQFARLTSLMEEHEVKQGTYIIQEGEPATELYFIKDGEVEVLKSHAESGEDHPITTIGAGATIGEVALLDRNPRSASIRTTTDSVLLKLSFADLDRSSKERRPLESQVKLNLAQDLAGDLRHTNQAVVNSLRKSLESERSRVAMGVIINTLLIGIAVYVFSLAVIEELSERVAATTFVSVPILFFFGALSYFAVRRSGYPFSLYGFTTENSWRSIRESMPITAAFVILIIITKWILVQYHPRMEGDAVFSIVANWEQFLTPTNLVVIAAYTLFVPIQEF
ncbi:MAG TPA: cyclic nucleotide-binding domain-containing protein, partial [Alkalispirochaeta sp.]|nr:cyclic nucleotide-binding domain-containing protein [Alkalispirochaeta sp.]